MNTFFILVGVPASGKSTWILNQQWDENTAVVSTDEFVEKYAAEQGKTYSEVFTEFMPTAINMMMDKFYDSIENDFDIVWDQTSVTRESRAKKLKLVPPTYRKVCVVFPTPSIDILTKRLASRPGKVIPMAVVESMISRWEEPQFDEGFDAIIYSPPIK